MNLRDKFGPLALASEDESAGTDGAAARAAPPTKVKASPAGVRTERVLQRVWRQCRGCWTCRGCCREWGNLSNDLVSVLALRMIIVCRTCNRMTAALGKYKKMRLTGYIYG